MTIQKPCQSDSFGCTDKEKCQIKKKVKKKTKGLAHNRGSCKQQQRPVAPQCLDFFSSSEEKRRNGASNIRGQVRILAR